jgi:2-polyprenyl-6-methoxyphenol hydroxylase-like FAD-dependent oxidoreductase
MRDARQVTASLCSLRSVRTEKGHDIPMTASSFTDVLIVGAGPVGLTLANDLARRGITCRIIDQRRASHNEIRAKGLTPRTEEVFEDLGILDQVHARGSRNRPFRFYERDRLVRELDPATDPTNQPTPDAPYRGAFIISQAQTEAVLREHLVGQGGHVELDCELVHLTQNADDVTALLIHAGKKQTIQARYLVGCDGGHSTVRRLCDFPFLGETLPNERHINAGLFVNGLDPEYMHVWADPVQGLFLSPMPYDGIWIFQAAISSELHDTSLSTFQRIFDERAGLPGVHVSDLQWTSIWRPNIRMVKQYRKGRVLLAGDAAHVHSPAGGQGLNTGIQDAYNLGWKLAHVVKGAPDTLLETYQAERLPIAWAVLATTTARHKMWLHQEVASGDGKALIQSISDLLTSKDAIADATQLSITYRGGPLACDLDETTGIRAGDRAPDAPCIRAASSEKVRLFDLFRGPHWTLLTFGDCPVPQLPTIFTACLSTYTIIRPGASTGASRHVVVDVDGYIHHFYGISGDALILVRPDGYIGLTGGKVDQEPILNYLNTICR